MSGQVTTSTVPASEQQTYAGNDSTCTQLLPQRSLEQYVISDLLQKAAIPVVLLLGSFGNVMTVLVMRALRTQFGDPSMGVYFPCLALCDQTVLSLGLGRRWIRTLFLCDVRTLHVAACKLHKFLVYSVSRMSTLILVSVTSQRVLTVTWPMRQRATNTKKRAKVVVGVIVALCCLVDCGILVVYHPQTRNGKTECRPVKASAQAAFYQDMVVPWLNSVTCSWLPFVILVVNNFVLGYSVRQSATASRHLTDSQQADVRSKQATSLSVTLIVTSLSFILLTSPIPATLFIKDFGRSSASPGCALEADFVPAKAALDLLWYCNSAVNFYLYFLTGPTFRRAARRLLCRGQRRGPRSRLPARADTTGPGSPSSTFTSKHSVQQCVDNIQRPRVTLVNIHL